MLACIYWLYIQLQITPLIISCDLSNSNKINTLLSSCMSLLKDAFVIEQRGLLFEDKIMIIRQYQTLPWGRRSHVPSKRFICLFYFYCEFCFTLKLISMGHSVYLPSYGYVYQLSKDIFIFLELYLYAQLSTSPLRH